MSALLADFIPLHTGSKGWQTCPSDRCARQSCRGPGWADPVHQVRPTSASAGSQGSLRGTTHGFSESVERFTGVPECRVQVGESEERLVVVPLNAAHRSIWATAREARPGLCIVRMPV